MRASADTTLRHFRKEALNEVEPAPAGGREVNVVTRMPRQPTADLGDLVRTVVVHHQVHVYPWGELLLDPIQKPQELLMPMQAVAGADRHAGSYIHSCEQRRNSVPLVIVRLARRDTGRQRQNRFGPIQRLHLAFFIHSQHNGAIRRIEVQAHDVPHLLHKLRVLGKFEVLHPMRLQSEGMPDAHDSVLRQSGLLGH
jgi:hypothetical protein